MKDLSEIVKLSNKKVDKNMNLLMQSVLISNGKSHMDIGTEAFKFLDKAFYTVDHAIQGAVKGIVDYFHTVDVLLDDMIEYRTKTPNIGDLYKLRNDYIDLTKRVKFYTISKKKTPVLMGLNITFKELFSILNNNMQYVNGAMDTLKDFDKFLDKILDSKKDNLNVKVDKSNVNAIMKNTEKINQSLAKVTNNKILTDRLPISKVVKNFDELTEVINNTLKIGSVYNMERLENINSFMDDLVIKLDVIFKSLEKEKAKINKDTLKAIEEYVGTVAKFITAIAFVNYLYYQLTDMLIAVIKIMKTTKEDYTVIDSIAYTIKNSFDVIKDFAKALAG